MKTRETGYPPCGSVAPWIIGAAPGPGVWARCVVAAALLSSCVPLTDFPDLEFDPGCVPVTDPEEEEALLTRYFSRDGEPGEADEKEDLRASFEKYYDYTASDCGDEIAIKASGKGWSKRSKKIGSITYFRKSDWTVSRGVVHEVVR